MIFNETFSVAAFNICREEVNLNLKRNLQVPLKNFSRFEERQGVRGAIPLESTDVYRYNFLLSLSFIKLDTDISHNRYKRN